MSEFIDLDRRFRELTTAELEDPDTLASLNESDYFGNSIAWPELLENRRVLLLAEAGSGKTEEMQEQSRFLRSKGHYAFFFSLESLDRDPVEEVASKEDLDLLGHWKRDGDSHAWFFLDAVDELKLTMGTLERALRRFARSIDGFLGRAHVIISCRPIDWQPSLDLATVRKHLPLPERPLQEESIPGGEESENEDLFLRVFRQSREESRSELSRTNQTQTGSEVVQEEVKAVVLLPMGEKQISLFSERKGVKDTAGFLSEIRRQNAWAFARRPLDLLELAAVWNEKGRLGTRAEQHEANIGVKLKESPNRRDNGVLADSEAREGAERLAFALALTKKRTIKSPEQPLDPSRGDGVLDPAKVLTDWSEAKRQSLLRRALFDPATYGRVRFHHRSVQEYLAACRLARLRKKEMSNAAIFRLLLAERYGEKIVIPSMKPIAAWLSIWDDDVRGELTRREPEALLSFGDPESLDVSVRAQLLEAFVNAYGAGSWRGLHVAADELRRLAHPDLGGTIRKLWGKGPTNVDVRELLLGVIEQGPIQDCMDIAAKVAFNPKCEHDQRVIAFRSLLSAGHGPSIKKMEAEIGTKSGSFPDKIAMEFLPDLFLRKIISVKGLLGLAKRIKGGQTTESHVLVLGLRGVVAGLGADTKAASEIRDGLANLILRGRYPEIEPYHIRGRYDHLSSALALVCEKQMGNSQGPADPLLIRACVIASRFRGDNGHLIAIPKLREYFGDSADLRRGAFWAEAELFDKLFPNREYWNRFWHAEHNSLIEYFKEADRPWLEAALEDESRPKQRPIALLALLALWQRRRSDEGELAAIQGLLGNCPELKRIFADRTAPPKPDPEYEKMERDSKRIESAAAKSRDRQLQGWADWRKRVIENPAEAFGEKQVKVTISNCHAWLEMHSSSHSSYNVWDRPAISSVFSPEIAERITSAFKSHWRNTDVRLWGERPADQRNSVLNGWIYALSGLSAEAEEQDWAKNLTENEAQRAVAIATVEMNGLAPFITELAESHPSAVRNVLEPELTREVSLAGSESYLPLLQNLCYASSTVKRLLAPCMAKALACVPTDLSETGKSHWAQHLGSMLRVLVEADDKSLRLAVEEECARGYLSNPTGPLGMVWLRGLCKMNPDRGIKEFIGFLSNADGKEDGPKVLKAMAGLFGERDSGFGINDPEARARALKVLVRLAYKFVRHQEDQVHKGSYTPNTRDHAEWARDFLLSTLLDTPGEEAHRAILELSQEPDFAHFPDRLRLLARRRAGIDSEFPPYSTDAIASLEKHSELPPEDRDALFSTMMERLADLDHEFQHHDFTERGILRAIEQETGMQRTLARRLEGMAKEAYRVAREEKVADEKEPDIRLLAKVGDQKAAIEVKIADNWTVPDLEQALQNQLVGQYLRFKTCKAGCLLISYHGRKKSWDHPQTGIPMQFMEVVAYLQEKARELEAKSRYDLRVAVFALDLTDPYLAPAHRKKTARKKAPKSRKS